MGDLGEKCGNRARRCTNGRENLQFRGNSCDFERFLANFMVVNVAWIMILRVVSREISTSKHGKIWQWKTNPSYPAADNSHDFLAEQLKISPAMFVYQSE